MSDVTLYLFDGSNLFHAGAYGDRDALVDDLASFVGALEQRVARAARLEDDHAHRVRDDVVQLARDSRSLLAERGLRLLLAFGDRRARDPADSASSVRRSRRHGRES